MIDTNKKYVTKQDGYQVMISTTTQAPDGCLAVFGFYFNDVNWVACVWGGHQGLAFGGEHMYHYDLVEADE